MPIPGETANDFIYSSDNIVYSEWKKTFAFLPVTTKSGKKVWFRKVYVRTRKMRVEPPQFPVNKFNRKEWATSQEIVYHELSGKWT